MRVEKVSVVLDGPGGQPEKVVVRFSDESTVEMTPQQHEALIA